MLLAFCLLTELYIITLNYIFVTQFLKGLFVCGIIDLRTGRHRKGGEVWKYLRLNNTPNTLLSTVGKCIKIHISFQLHTLCCKIRMLLFWQSWPDRLSASLSWMIQSTVPLPASSLWESLSNWNAIPGLENHRNRVPVPPTCTHTHTLNYTQLNVCDLCFLQVSGLTGGIMSKPSSNVKALQVKRKSFKLHLTPLKTSRWSFVTVLLLQ